MFGAFGTASISGAISGINWDQFVRKLMELERQPLVRLQNRKSAVENQKKLLGEFRARLSDLRLALSNLGLKSVVLAKTAVASGDSPAVSVKAGPDAAPGTFQVTVQQLATATVVRSGSAIGQPVDPTVPLSQAGLGIAPTAGTFSINGVSISIDPAVDSLNDIINRINTSGAGVTASLVNDVFGRPNILRLESASPIQLGSGADTSNFLTATRLTNGVQQNVSGVYRIDGAGNLGVTNVAAPVGGADARLVNPVTSDGSFRINGVTITYTLSDSINAIINRINSSAAGVTASYDPLQDRLVLMSKTTGNTRISLEDVSGNFLAATGLLSAPQSLGQNAVFTVSTVNNGQPLSSPTNTVSGLLPGITLELKDVTASPVTVTVSVDTGPGLSDRPRVPQKTWWRKSTPFWTLLTGRPATTRTRRRPGPCWATRR